MISAINHFIHSGSATTSVVAAQSHHHTTDAARKLHSHTYLPAHLPYQISSDTRRFTLIRPGTKSKHLLRLFTLILTIQIISNIPWAGQQDKYITNKEEIDVSADWGNIVFGIDLTGVTGLRGESP